MSSDIVTRLRNFRPTYGWPEEQATVVKNTLAKEAADRIEALEAELARLRKFRDIVEEFSEHDDPSVKYAMREALEVAHEAQDN